MNHLEAWRYLRRAFVPDELALLFDVKPQTVEWWTWAGMPSRRVRGEVVRIASYLKEIGHG